MTAAGVKANSVTSSVLLKSFDCIHARDIDITDRGTPATHAKDEEARSVPPERCVPKVSRQGKVAASGSDEYNGCANF